MTNATLRHILKILLISVVLAAASLHAAPDAPDNSFPMTVGTYWVYTGVVRWTHDINKTSETKVKWRTEIRRLVRHGQTTGIVVSGFPPDLDWSDGAQQPKDSLIVKTAENRFYHLQDVESSLRRLSNPADSLKDFLLEDDLFLQLPLSRGKKFCDPEAMAREDGLYCWLVESAARISLPDVLGVSPGPRTSYRLRYVTNPDDITFDFVPGIGLTSYEYHHHGTVADTELKLIEFHLAPAANE